MPSLTLAEMLIPPLPIVATLGWIALRMTRQQSWRRADGIVIEMVAGDEGTTKPRVQFTSEFGQTIAFTTSLASNPPCYHVGESVKVLYDPASPERACIDTFWQRWMGALIMLLVAIFVLPRMLYAAVHRLGW